MMHRMQLQSQRNLLQEHLFKEGYLHKQGPKEELIKSWKKRYFILKDNYLYYYASKEDGIPTGIIRLMDAKVRVASNATRNHSFEIVTGGRDYMIAADDSGHMFDWMTVLKDSIDYFKGSGQKQVPDDDNEDEKSTKRKPIQLNPKDIKRRGYIFKKGNNIIKDWRRRWFVLYKDNLYYYEAEDNPLPLGVIDLKSCKFEEKPMKPRKYYFDLVTPGGRTYYLYTEHKFELDDWLESLKQATAPLPPHAPPQPPADIFDPVRQQPEQAQPASPRSPRSPGSNVPNEASKQQRTSTDEIPQDSEPKVV